jgi:hypothetical protein
MVYRKEEEIGYCDVHAETAFSIPPLRGQLEY